MPPGQIHSVRFTDEEWNKIKQLAEASGVSASEHIRAAALGMPPRKVEPDKESEEMSNKIQALIGQTKLVPTGTIGLSAIYESRSGERHRLPPSARYVHPGISRSSLYCHGATLVATGTNLGDLLSERVAPTGSVGVTDAKRYPAWAGQAAVEMLSTLVAKPLSF